MCQVGIHFSHLSPLFCFRSCPGVHKEHRRSADSLLLVRDGKRDSLCPETEQGPLHVCAIRLSPRGQARDPVCRWGHNLWIRGGGVDSAALFTPKIQVDLSNWLHLNVVLKGTRLSDGIQFEKLSAGEISCSSLTVFKLDTWLLQVQVLPSQHHLLPGSGRLPFAASTARSAGQRARGAAETAFQCHNWDQRGEICAELTEGVVMIVKPIPKLWYRLLQSQVAVPCFVELSDRVL